MYRSCKQGVRAGFHLMLICAILISLVFPTEWATAAPDADIVVNGSFESGLASWETDNDASVSIQYGSTAQGGGDYRLGFWDDTAFTANTHQTVTELVYGDYVLSAWVTSSGGFNKSYMYAKAEGAPEMKVDIPASAWTKIELPVTVSSNSLTIGFYADGPANKWISVDLVSLTPHQGPITNPEGIDIVNRGFENGGSGESIEGWNEEGDTAASYVVEPGYDSAYSLSHGGTEAYRVATSQTISGLKEGYYTLTGWTQSSGGQKAAYLFANNNGTSESRTALPMSSDWTKVTVRGIHVTTGQVTVGLYSDAKARQWAKLDFVELVRDDRPHRLLKGGDVSEITYVESLGGKYYDRNGVEKDPFQILKENGQDIVRLRLYENPGKGRGDGTYYVPEGFMDKADILKLAKRAKNAGMQIVFSFHYSDYWSNGSIQIIPHKWQEQINGLANDAAKVDKLEQLVAEYTEEIMQALKDQGTTPEYVSLGNEMQSGILYPYGRAKDGTWENLGRFLTAGSNAVKKVSPSTKVIIHLDDAGNHYKYETLFDKLEEMKVPYDIIGPSYYPYWTYKSVQQIVQFCNDMIDKYDKDIMIMETGYNWHPTMPDGLPGQLSHNGPYSIDTSTPEGQKNFMIDLFNELKNAKNGRVIGDLYWDPVMIEVPGVAWALREADDQPDINGVSNTTLFDFEGKALPVHDAYLHNADGTVHGMINGVIRGTDGNRIGGAEIEADIKGTLRKVYADRNGNYLIPDVPAGTGYTLTAVKPGYQGGTSSVPSVVYGEIAPVDIIVAGGAISGIISDEQGQPVPNAIISVSGAGIVHSAKSNENGEYTLADLPEGQALTITAGKPGYTPESKPGVEVSIGEVKTGVNLTIVLSSGTIQGKVVDDEGTPITDAKVFLRSSGQLFEVRSDSHGVYMLPYVPAGQNYTVTSVKENYLQATKDGINVAVGKITDAVNFTLARNTGSISGKVTDSSSKPVSGVNVTAMSGLKVYRTTTNSSGSYSLPLVLAGNSYQVTAVKEGYIDGILSEVKVTPLKETSSTNLRLGTEVPIVNGDFETFGASPDEIPGWKLEGTKGASYVQQHSAVTQGKNALSSYAEGAYTTKVTQTVTGLADGDYVVSFLSYSGGGQKEYFMFAQAGSGSMAKLNIPPTGQMTRMSFNVTATGGVLTFGLQADANKGNWSLIDDVKLGYLGKEEPATEQPTPTPTPGTSLTGGVSGTPTPSPTASLTPVKVTNGTVSVTPAVGADGIAKATISVDDLTTAANAAGSGELKIVAALEKAAAGVQVQLPADPLTGKGGITTVTFDMGLASISLNPSLFLKSDGSSPGNILLTVAKSDKSNLSQAVKSQLGTADVLDITLLIDGKPVNLRGGAALVTLPYKLQPGQKPQQVVVYYINESGALEIIKNGQYDPSSGMAKFKVKHFSKYSAVYAQVSFSDLNIVPWAQASVEALAARDIVKGTAAGIFSPARNVTRAEFVSMLLGAFDLNGTLRDSSYSDVPGGVWYAKPVAVAEQLGIIQGKGDGTFGPGEPISRQDMAVMIYKAAQAEKLKFVKGQSAIPFVDYAGISAYASEAVNQLAAEGIISGMGNGSFAPQNNATRAQAAVIIERLMNFQ
ncbi:Endo-1,4-beta-xylanase A precursor [compost metagenome]